VCVDTTIALGMVRDLMVDRRVHKVRIVALPCIIVVQCFVVCTFRATSLWWMAIAHLVLG
jgi:hypothetical protein